MMNPDQQLTRHDLLRIVKEITHWEELARHLGLSEPEIATIKSDYAQDYNEQKTKMLLKWLDEQDTTPTRRDLVHVIEGQMNDRELAKKIDSVFLKLDIESEKSTRFRSQSGF